MKKILSGFISKKLTIGLLTMALLLSGLCFLSPKGSEVMASDSSTATFKVEQLELGKYTEKDENNNIVRTAPKPNTTSDYKDWIFAGWYTNNACTTPVSKTTETGTYYAKFVPSEVLSAKCQVSADTTSATSTSTSKLRIVSTVDSLKYSQVGFDIGFKGKAIEYSTSKVYSKIEAADDGVKYGFSPNIFDLQSEYFITATLINIKNEDFDEGILIKPYWVTKDGTKVYGVSRYARVEDSYLGIVNVPVRLYSNDTASSTTTTVNYDSSKLSYYGFDSGNVFSDVSVNSGTAGTATVSGSSTDAVITDGMLVNLRLKKTATLPKKNTFTVTSNLSNVSPVVYMNYINSVYGGTADTSWYNNTDTTFVLTTPEELFGLASLAKTNTFEGKTIYLGADITIQDNWKASKDAPAYPWTPIATFAGTLDGQGHAIDGVYINDENKKTYVGFFEQVSGTVQNLNLENSYVASNGLMTGSIAGFLSGDLKGVSSKAIVANTATVGTEQEGITERGNECGGLVGRFGSGYERTISNCWFDGTVTSNMRDLGGLVGRVAMGTKTIEHCLNTGTVTSNLNSGTWAGGLVGSVNAQGSAAVCLALRDSLNEGNVVSTHSKWVTGSVIGHVTKGDTVTFENSYATNESYTAPDSNTRAIGNVDDGVATNGSVTLCAESLIIGYAGYSNADFTLSFYTNSNKSQGGYWVTRTGDTPMLKTFADNWADYGWYNASATEVEIKTVQELYGFSEISQTDSFSGDTIKLVKDITVNEGTASNWGSATPKKAWTPIGTNEAFAGTFDGQGHTISGIYVNKTGDYSGLFAITTTSSNIKDLRLENSYIYGSGHHVGSIAGRGNGIFDKIYSDATVVSGGYNAGGIIGQMNEGANNQMTDCWFDGSVTGNRVGGMVGFALCYQLTMTNCLNTGSVSGGDYVGGLCGSRGGEASPNYFTIRNSIAVGELTGTNNANVGAIIGSIEAGKEVDANFVYGRTEYSVVGKNIGTLKTGTVDLLSKEQFVGAQARYSTALGFYGEEEATDNWVARKGEYLGIKYFVPKSEWYTGDEQIIADTSWYDEAKDTTNGSTFVIDTAAKLYGLAKKAEDDSYWHATVKLGADITVNIGDADEWGTTAAVNNWTPIGSAYPFTGKFNGQGYTIKGLYLDTNTQYGGLFARVDINNSQFGPNNLANFRIENSYFQSSSANLGSVAGYIGVDMSNVYSDAVVVTSNKQCGGLVGQFNGAKTISNCWFDGTVMSTCKSTMQGCGGIIGLIDKGTNNITQCLNTGKVTVDTDLSGGMIGAGGLIGQIQGASGATVIVNMNDCISVGEIQMDHPNGAGSVFGFSKKCDDGIGSVTVNIANTYTNQKYSGDKGCNATQGIGLVYEGTTCAVKPTVLTDAQLKGAQARYNTPFGFYGEDETTDNWVTRQNDYPGLTKFVAESERYTGDEEIIADTSWYKKDATNGSTYVIDTAAKLYGLAVQSESDSYFYATVKLGADITINIGDANEWGTKAAVNNWEPISRTYAFLGKFDGQGHTIKGLYMDSDTQYSGLFAQVNTGTFNSEENYFKNFRIENSYFQSSASNLGSVAGSLAANMSNVYSNAIVVTSNKQCGGLVGQFNNFKTISDCWFDGTIISTCKDEQQGCGGLIGLVDRGANKIENCLNTGDITVTSGRTAQLLGVGGLVGMSINAADKMIQLDITDCINAGVVSVDHPRGTGSVIGVLNNTTEYTNTLILTNVYTTNQYVETSSLHDWTEDVCTGIGINLNSTATVTGAVIEVSEDDRFIGYAAYDTDEKLDFENTWVLRKEGVPAPKVLVSVAEQYTTVDTDLALSTLGTDITLCENGVDAGDGSYVISVSDTDGSIYANYLAALNEKDFEVYASNDDGLGKQGVQNVVYTKSEDGFKWMVSVTHAGNEKQKTYVAVSTSEVLSSHLKGAVTYTKDDAYTTSNKTATLTMMQLTNTSSSGNSFVIQLSNGHFIINDGGFADDLSNLIAYLKELSNGQKPIIEAWVVSHAHSDHVGAFEKIYTDAIAIENPKQWADELYVEGIYYNESAAYVKGNFEPTISTNPETEGTIIYDAVYSLYYENIQRGMALLKTTEGNTPEVYRYRTGQRFTFADVTMDVVQMEEQILDCERLKTDGYYHDGSNGTSTSVMFTINDKRVYIGGDESYDNMLDFTAKAYNDTYFNNLDVYVAPHHGANTYDAFGSWCTNNGSAKFGMVLFPCVGQNPPLWQGVSTETSYKLITKFTTDQNVYTYANGNVVLTFGDTISVSE